MSLLVLHGDLPLNYKVAGPSISVVTVGGVGDLLSGY